MSEPGRWRRSGRSGRVARSLRGAGAIILVLAAATGGAARGLAAQTTGDEREEIVSYDVVLDVHDGNRMTVEETITVRRLGREILRGIYRDVPTSFPKFSGLARIDAPFEVTEVLRNGASEPWSLERIGGPGGRGGVRVRIGAPDVLLDNGLHAYTIRYETARWMRFGDSADTLYWNVTGNGWAFPIERASARVVLPRGVEYDRLGLESWTGPEGSTVSNASVTRDAASGTPVFTTSRPLRPREGLTIRVSLPKGVVQPPTAAVRARWARLDWRPSIEAAVVTLLIIGLYLVMWALVGRDRAGESVVVRYDPPEGFSPAALGYLAERGWDGSLLPAALVSLAVQGALEIERDDSTWILRRSDVTPTDLAPEESRLLRDLLGSRKTLTLSGYSSPLRNAMTTLKSGLKRALERHYFVLNRRWFLGGVAMSLAGLLALAVRDPYGVPVVAAFLVVWLGFWTLGAGSLLIRAGQAWRAALGGGGALAWVSAGVVTVFASPFWIAEIVVFGVLLTLVPRSLALAAIILGGVNVLFYHLLERPTLKGRGVFAELEGFRRFLAATDADRLDRLNPPERTPELFERFLPHAIALGVENRWAEAFEGSLPTSAAGSSASAGASPIAGLSGASLGWYSGAAAGGVGALASSLGGSFSSSLSSASTPPSSSSGGGSSGGGSSGGGGGGGGGGGW